MYRSILVSLSALLLVLSVSSSSSNSSNDDPPTIRQTSNGPVEGVERVSSLGQKYYSFRGIPFAEAPITGQDPFTGEQIDRRFKAPMLLKFRWTDPLKVHDFGNACVQPEIKEGFPVNISKMGEDCLFLNVYVPAGGSKQKTVLVWIYGGGFNIGDSTENLYGSDFLISQDNIVVTINYRLGMLGFLNLNFGEYTGNMGLKDQQLALKWIHENIEKFSGNRNEVLIFGQSAGAVSVHLQILNKESRSYFQRAFVASGSALQPYTLTKADHVQRAQECLKVNDGMDKLIAHLRTVNSSILLSCLPLEAVGEINGIWVPVIERNDTKNAFLTKTPEEIYNDSSEEALIMDTMFSYASQESLLTLLIMNPSEISIPLIKENVMETTKFQLPFKGFTKAAHPKEYEEALKKLRKAYFFNVTNVYAIKRANAGLLSDSQINFDIIKATALQANANHKTSSKTGPKNTFLFRFNVTADFNLASIIHVKLNEAVHTDDICYSFHCHLLDKTKKYDKHLKNKDLSYDLIMRSVKMITNFARTGDPSIEGDTPFKSINSIDELFCQEVANDLKTSVTHDIRDQIHYDVWQEIEEIYKSLNL